ncbi:MAG: ribose-phosphate diphosphokinase [Candidatus Saliniplasma sp.]
MLIKGPGSPKLSERLIERNDLEFIEVRSKVFPDGEIYVNLSGSVEGEDCYLVQTTYPNRRLLELFFIQDALFGNGAKSVNVIVPYFSYARQDQMFQKGEAISSRAIAERIQIQASSFYSVDLHSKKIIDFFDIDAVNHTAMGLLGVHSELYEPDLLISPDEGGINRIKKAAEEIDTDWDYLEKKRLDGETVEIKPKNINVEGKKVVILDDIISTGGTMREAAKQLLEQGAEQVHAGCTHGLFVDNAYKKLDEICDSVFCTDTIEAVGCEVTVAPLFDEIF